jgi:hypothetical protein
MRRWAGVFLAVAVMWYPVSVGASGEDYSRILWNSESAARWEVGMSIPQAEAWYDILGDGVMLMGAASGFAALTVPVVGKITGVLGGLAAWEAYRLKRCSKNFTRGVAITGYSWRIPDWQWNHERNAPVQSDRWYSLILSCRTQEVA